MILIKHKFAYAAAVCVMLSCRVTSAQNAPLANANEGQKSEKITRTMQGETSRLRNLFQDVTAEVELDRAQSMANGSIAFSVTMVNKGKQEIEFINPLEFNMLFLTDNAGHVLRLACSEPRWADERRFRPLPRTLNVPFQIVQARLDDKVLSKQEIENSIFRLRADSKLRFDLKLEKAEKIMAKSETEVKSEPNCLPADKLEKLVAGNYKIGVALYVAGFSQQKPEDIKSLDDIVQPNRQFWSGLMDVELK